jgi:hypothetical protein
LLPSFSWTGLKVDENWESGRDNPNSDNLFVVYFREEFINSMGETLEMECRMSNYDCLAEYKCFANDFFESFNSS